MTTTKKHVPSTMTPPTFEHNGETYTFEKALKAGVIRKHRELDADEAVWVILEEIAGEKALEAIDDMTLPEFQTFVQEVFGGNLGES